MNLDNIPYEIKELDQWVCTRGDSKVPRRAYMDGAASSTDVSTWSSFDMARSSVEGGYNDYVGFVFNDNGIVGIDIDDGYDEDGFLSPLAADIIGRCASYTEKSKSGTGFHILLYGDIPFKGKNNLAGIEMYKTARFFIMTGNVLGFKYLINNQEALDTIVEKYFPETRESKTTTVTPRIYNPEWDHSKGSKRVKVRPNYPVIPDGCRNICLTSLAGMMHSIGYTKGQIYRELQYANSTACRPPLLDGELKTICNSVTRYRR